MGNAVEDAGLSVNRDGKVVQSIGNCVRAICRDERLKGMFRRNELSDRIEVSGAWWKRPSINLSDNDMNNVRLYLEQTYGLTHEKNIPRAVEIVANQNSYHPIRQCLSNLQWDGVERIGNLLPRYLGAKKCDYTTAATKLFLFGTIERVFNPGVKFETMLCVVDDKQGGGKSTMARLLAIRDEWFSDDVKNLEDENVYRKLQGHWIIEFSEMLATSNTKTVEAIKSFLSRQKDTYKIPYDRYPHDFPRQCVFLGTTNDAGFLPNDKTGNRRFIPVLADSGSAEVHPLEDEAETRAYILQAWAEAMELRRQGKHSLVFPKQLQPELAKNQEEFMPEDPKIGIIQEWLDTCQYDSVCSRMIYREALGGYGEPKPWEIRAINDIMNKSIIGWAKHPTSDSKVRISGYGKQRAWDRARRPRNSVPKSFAPVDDSGEQLELPFK